MKSVESYDSCEKYKHFFWQDYIYLLLQNHNDKQVCADAISKTL